MVIVLLAQAADTPEGSPVTVPMPVAPFVAWVMAVKAVLIQSVGVEEAAPTVLTALKVAMAPDHCELVLMVPPVVAVKVAVAIFSSAKTLALFPAVPLVEAALVILVNELVGVPNVYPLFTQPIPPINNSLAIAVVPVVPVEPAVELPVEFANTSSALADRMLLYSITTAADLKLACVIAMAVVADETFNAYQISVVVPLVLVACVALAQVAPV